MDIKQPKYFTRKEITVRKAIKEMCDSGFEQYKFLWMAKWLFLVKMWSGFVRMCLSRSILSYRRNIKWN